MVRQALAPRAPVALIVVFGKQEVGLRDWFLRQEEEVVGGGRAVPRWDRWWWQAAARRSVRILHQAIVVARHAEEG